MTATANSLSSSHLDFDLSFLQQRTRESLNRKSLQNFKDLHEKYTRLGYESLGISAMTCDAQIAQRPLFCVKKGYDVATRAIDFSSDGVKALLASKKSQQTSRDPLNTRFTIRILTENDKVALAAGVTNGQTAINHPELQIPPEWVKSYGDEQVEPKQIVLLEFPSLGGAEEAEKEAYSELEATASIVHSCVQVSFKHFKTLYITAIPGDSNRADLLSMLGFSYSDSKQRDDPHFKVTPDTKMIIYPQIREAWENKVSSCPFYMPPSLATSK